MKEIIQLLESMSATGKKDMLTDIRLIVTSDNHYIRTTDGNLVAAHCVHLTDAEMARMAAAGATVCGSSAETVEGVDLVTEGVITVNRVVEYAQDYISENRRYDEWSNQKDGASLISQLLFEEATDINFYVGRAINPAHQNPDLPINFSIKMNLVQELSAALQKMGKRIKVSYF